MNDNSYTNHCKASYCISFKKMKLFGVCCLEQLVLMLKFNNSNQMFVYLFFVCSFIFFLLFVCSLVRLFVCPFIRLSFLSLFVRSFFVSFVCLFFYILFFCSFVRLFVYILLNLQQSQKKSILL